MPMDCEEIKTRNLTHDSGYYYIDPDGSGYLTPFRVRFLCFT